MRVEGSIGEIYSSEDSGDHQNRLSPRKEVKTSNRIQKAMGSKFKERTVSNNSPYRKNNNLALAIQDKLVKTQNKMFGEK